METITEQQLEMYTTGDSRMQRFCDVFFGNSRKSLRHLLSIAQHGDPVCAGFYVVLFCNRSYVTFKLYDRNDNQRAIRDRYNS